MKSFCIGVVLFLTIGLSYLYFNNNNNNTVSAWKNGTIKSGVKIKKGGAMDQYNYEELRKRQGLVSKIEWGGNLDAVDLRREKEEKPINFESKVFYFKSNGKTVSGMANYRTDKKRPTIIMIRGFAEAQGYYVGFGTWKVADELARNGFNTFSLDFLGFGRSENESGDIMEARFAKIPQVLDLIASVKELEMVDKNKIGIWSHSNGGQIAMSVLEISGEKWPTIMWAPMTKPFPRSIIEQAGNDENGKIVKNAVAKFEEKYDATKYAINTYYDWIRAPILIRQGTADAFCKVEWQQRVRDDLTKLGKDIKLEIYQKDDHNLSNNWDAIVALDVDFFKKFLF